MKISKKTAFLGLFTALALILSFAEALLPPVFTYAPGIKIGLPNIIIIFLLYRFSLKSAAAVSLVRILITAMLFGSVVSLAYSIAGAVLSLTVMWLLKRLNAFSIPVISIVGAILHNIAQIFVAVALMGTSQLFYYLPILLLSGLISGVLVGVLSTYLIKVMKKVII